MADAKFSFADKAKSYHPQWMAPEALGKSPKDINVKAADMWSFAILLWELSTREVPFLTGAWHEPELQHSRQERTDERTITLHRKNLQPAQEVQRNRRRIGVAERR